MRGLKLRQKQTEPEKRKVRWTSISTTSGHPNSHTTLKVATM